MTDHTTRITDPAIIAAAVADERLKFYVTMNADEVSFALALVMSAHPAAFDEVADIVRDERNV